MNRVYLASFYGDKERMKAVAEMLTRLGFSVVSTWHDRPDGLTPDQKVTGAIRCEDEIMRCDTLILFEDEPVAGKGDGGHDTELGMARTRNRTIIAVGGKSNVFHYLPGVTWVPDLPALLQYLEDRQYAAWMVER